MGKEDLTFVDVGIKKDKFYTAIKSYFLEDVDIENIFISIWQDLFWWKNYKRYSFHVWWL